MEEVKAPEALKLSEGSVARCSLNARLFSFYFASVRISDVLRMEWTGFQNNRLHYKMGKNDKDGSLKLPEKVIAILTECEGQKEENNGLVFPELKDVWKIGDAFTIERSIAFATSRLDKYLRRYVAPLIGLSKPVTMHIARYSFGNISGDKIPVQMLQKLYRHSSITTTIGYQANFMHKDADEALDNVIGFLSPFRGE